MRFAGFIGPSYTLQSVNVDCQRSLNLFPEIDEIGTGKEREVAALVPTPGIRLLVTLSEGPVRGLWRASNDMLYAVGGSKFYQISSSFVAEELGTLKTTTGPVSLADNGLQVVVVDGKFGYTWDLGTSTFAEITDPSFPGADQVVFQDGYLIFNQPDSNTFYITGLNEVTFDPTDIGKAEGSPDNIVGILSNLQNLYVFGTQTTEVFYDSGDVFPFTRIQGALIEVGCVSAFSIALIQGMPYWLGRDDMGFGVVYRAQGYQPQRISTPAIESVIRALGATAAESARAWTYQQGGHAFYCLNIPGDSRTWVYDTSTSLWHERVYLNSWSIERHRADCHASAYGLNIVGDYVNGNVYALDPDSLTDNGVSIVRERTSPHLSNGLLRLFYDSFQLDMEVGVGTATGQGQNPQAMLQWSDDGGHSWSNEHWADIGKIGQRLTRVKWRRLGSSRDRVYRVRITDPVKVVLIGVELGTQEGGA